MTGCNEKSGSGGPQSCIGSKRGKSGGRSGESVGITKADAALASPRMAADRILRFYLEKRAPEVVDSLKGI